jgi:hypothetical protein
MPKNIEDEIMTSSAAITNTLEMLADGVSYNAQHEVNPYYNLPKDDLKKMLVFLASQSLELYTKLR